MKLKTQSTMLMLLFGAALVVIAVSAIITNSQVREISRQQKIAGNIAQGASELSYLANDYLLYGEPQLLKRWHTRFRAFAAEIMSLRVEQPAQRALVRNITVARDRMKEIFDGAAAVTRGVDAPLDPAYLRVSWSRMAVQSQALASDASRLSRQLSAREKKAKEMHLLVVLAMIGIFGAYFLFSSLLIQRRMLASIAALHAGATVIGSGNLDHVIETRQQDEIGALVSAFNQMAGQLKVTTVSRDTLSREVEERKQAEEALRRNREWLRVTLTSIGDAVIACDADGRITFLNPVAAALSGWATEDALDQPIQTIFHMVNEVTGAPSEDIVGRVLREGRVVELANHTALVTRDGRQIPIEDSAAPIMDSAGQVMGAVIVFHDVTEKRRAEEALFMSERRLIHAESTAKMGHWEWDLSTEELHWSPGIYTILELSASVTPSLDLVLSLIHPDDRPRFQDALAGVQRGEVVPDLDLRGSTPDGNQGYVCLSFEVIRDDEGQVIKLFGTMQDITERKQAEAAIHTSEERFRAIFEQGRIGIAAVGLDGHFLYANPAYLDLLGYTADEIVLLNFAEVTHPEDLAREQDLIMVSLEKRTHGYEIEKRYRRKDGAWVWVRLNTNLLCGADSEPYCAIAMVEDITVRKQAEAEREHLLQALAHHSRELQAILENTDTQMAVLDRDFTIVAVNSAYVVGCGHAREELVGQPHFALFPNDDNLAIFTRVRETGVPYHASEKPFCYTDQPERGVTYWNWVFTPVSMPDGTVDRFLLSLTDMTHHVRARQEMERLTRELQRQNAQMEAVMMSQAHGMVVYAPTGEIVTMNQAAESLLRYQPLERDMTVEERAVTFRILDEQGQPMAAADAPTARALRGETTYGTVMALQWPDRVLWVSASAAPIRLPDGQMLGAVASFTDVTALHALQEQMKTFIHTVSHDLRAPLTVIQGYTSMLLDGLTPDSDPLTRAGMTAIDRGVRRLDTMIEDLVAAARLEGGQMELTPRPLRLQAFLPELVNHNAAVLDASRIVLDLPADLPPALADDARLERILLNLLTNARKYSAPETPIRVSVRLDDDRLAIRVADQGQGIHPDDLPRLFEKFYRARGERRPDGIGLGLYITRLLTEAHGGTLSVESTLGQGSTFTVTLPVAVESPVV